MAGWSFAAPWLLAALAVLPALWWLLRLTPPAPRRQAFPSVFLLLGLDTAQTTPAQTPPWLLLLRLVAAGLAIVGLAGPVRRAPHPPASAAPVLLVIDNGWAAAIDWDERMREAARTLAEAAPGSARLRVLTTAADPQGAAPALSPLMAVADLPSLLAAARPMAWAPDRVAAAQALAAAPTGEHVIYVADGVAAAGDRAFGAALARIGPVTELRSGTAPVLLRPVVAEADQLALRAETLPGHVSAAAVRAVDPAGAVLAAAELAFDASGSGTGALVLPPRLRNRVSALRLAGQASAGGVVLLDEGVRRRPVGLVTTGVAADEPLTGVLFYVRRALGTGVELQTGGVRALAMGGVSVIIAADTDFADAPDLPALTAWVRRGGVLIRFAGPTTAGSSALDPLLPVRLLPGDRALGGAMSWSQPQGLAPFAATSPFAGLAIPAEVRVSRQVLAQPGDAAGRSGREDWATLQDGTPLVTAAPLGAGRLVLFHVTANADWSNLPLSGLFVDMLRRLVALSVGVKPQSEQAMLAPLRALDGFGQLGTPGEAARALSGAQLHDTPAGPAHPPGLYGPAQASRAFNLGAVLPPLGSAPPVPGAMQLGLGGAATAEPAGPMLLAAALVLLALDLLVALRLRGLLGAAAAVLLALLGSAAPAHAGTPELPSLATHLAYVVTGDGQADGIAAAGLRGLSAFVNARTAAELDTPVGVDPSRDDLSFYPLLYWPVLSGTAVPDGDTVARLTDYMGNGGIIVFDTRDAAAPDAGAQAALQRLGAALAVPPLQPLTRLHVLSHSFYVLRDWPGAQAGGTVWVARAADRLADGVSPVVIGGGNWAAAWAVDNSGATPYEVVPGGEAQRLEAYRFGVNLVMYALTGNYKADQVHVPELLRRMGADTVPTDLAAPDAPP